MRIRAACRHCGREFLLFQLYTAAAGVGDRCPHCSRHLGIVNVGPLAARADRALRDLVDALNEMGGRHPQFTLGADSVLVPITDALGSFAPVPAPAGSVEQGDKQRPQRRGWPLWRAAA